jgi:hypothetical protein
MPEKPPPFVVNDRRKFTAEGDIREGYTPPVETAAPFQPEAAPAEPAALASSAKVVTFPNRSTVEADEPGLDAFSDVANASEPYGAPGYDVDGDGLSSDEEADAAEQAGELGPPPTAAETAAQHSAYQRSAREMDALLQQANPGMKAPAAVGFEHIVQSFYLSAIMAMGAGTEPNQKPRIDILGARQAIDMLNVLEEKTRGNLNENEQRLIQGVTFELRMMFLELTNAIAAQAHQPPPTGRK